MFRYVFFVAVLSSFTPSQADDPSYYRTTIRHIESGGLGYEDGYTTFEAFVASDPSQWACTPFLDIRNHVFNDGKWAVNMGGGLRALRCDRIYGLNAYYDYRNTGRFDTNQVGMGLESLGDLFDFRMNGYLPVGKKTSNPFDSAFESFVGNSMILSQKYHSAMKGLDAEFGFHFGKSASFDFYAAIGPYYFKGEKEPAACGGKARVIGIFKDMLSVEISNSYDRVFHNKFQGQISLNFTFGPHSKERESPCHVTNTLYKRILQPVGRQEIIVVDNARRNTVATDPDTGLPLFFVFVDNTSLSDGTFESPYHSLAQAQDNSSPNNIIYVFPGDGTTNEMDSGIILQDGQRFWGSGISHSIQTAEGTISIPAFSSTSPTITNTNVDTEGNAITLASNNAISGFIITSSLNDAIYGANAQNLDVSYCTFQNTNTYAIEASFSGNASISLTNNQFVNNVNGVYFTLNGTSNVICSDNIFTGQTSVSSVPLEISASNNSLAARIENNLFDNNTTGSMRFYFDTVNNANINVVNNTITNSGTGSQSSLGSSFVIIADGTTDHCSVALTGNTFSENTSNALYLHTSGAFNTLETTATENIMSNIGGSGLVFATPVEVFTLVATDNTIVECNDNGIAVIGSGLTSTGNITISHNTITDIGNASNGIAINQDFSTLNLTIQDNEISRCEGTGIISYAPTGIGQLILDISGNTINNCQNLSSNSASALDIEQYENLVGSITNNTILDNAGVAVFIGSTLPSPAVCLRLSGNNSTEYLLVNPGDGIFNLRPTDVEAVNIGVINMSGVINLVESCL